MTKRPPAAADAGAEWLEADGLGGFASGTVGGLRTRRSHALLLSARRPPAERMALVNGLDAWVETPRGRFDITSQRYAPGVVAPSGGRRLEAFSIRPWPRWSLVLDDGTRVDHELFVPKGSAATVLTWRTAGFPTPARLVIRPFLSGRDAAALHYENEHFRFDAEVGNGRVAWRPYPGVPRRDRHLERDLRPRAPLVSPVPLRGGPPPRARFRGRPGRAGHDRVRPFARGGAARLRRPGGGSARAVRGPRGFGGGGRAEGHGRPPPLRLPLAPPQGGGRVRRGARRRADDRGRLSRARGRGPGHVHRAAWRVSGWAPARRCALHPPRLRGRRLAWDGRASMARSGT
jgi:hypothetical protein